MLLHARSVGTEPAISEVAVPRPSRYHLRPHHGSTDRGPHAAIVIARRRRSRSRRRRQLIDREIRRSLCRAALHGRRERVLQGGSCACRRAFRGALCCQGSDAQGASTVAVRWCGMAVHRSTTAPRRRLRDRASRRCARDRPARWDRRAVCVDESRARVRNGDRCSTCPPSRDVRRRCRTTASGQSLESMAA